MTKAIEANGIGKAYGPLAALDDLDLEVQAGTVFSLLGPNGAGKTTIVRILATLIRPDTGRARVAGHDVVTEVHAVRREISITGQYAALDSMATGEENLVMVGRLSGLTRRDAHQRAIELAERFELAEVVGRRVRTYSGGTRRRLDLAASLMRPPRVLFLDEPTTGLDVRGRLAIWDVVTELAATGVTIFLTTQYLEEADRVADDIGILDRGRIVARGSALQLKRSIGDRRLELSMEDTAAFAAVTQRLGPRARLTNADALSVVTATDGSAPDVRRLLDEVDPDGSLVARFAIADTTLDDVFLATTGGAIAP